MKLDWDWMYLTFGMIARCAEEQAKLPENYDDRFILSNVSSKAWDGRRLIAEAIRNRKPEIPANAGEAIF